MPEGDTLLRAARRLAPALEGKTLRALRARLGALGASLVGRRIERVEARGKNLLIHLEGGRAIHTHLGMAGSWELYRAGERWRRPAHLARVVLEVDDAIAVCFLAAHVELIASGGGAAGPAEAAPLGHLGPDLLAEELAAAEALRRLRASDARPLGEALLDQRVVAGIGNVYKSEALFLARLDPFAPVSALDDATLDALLARTRKLMRANLDGARRDTTRFGGGGLARERHWVYDRSGAPCLRCGATVRMRRQGEQRRSTYFCPRCQAVTGA